LYSLTSRYTGVGWVLAWFPGCLLAGQLTEGWSNPKKLVTTKEGWEEEPVRQEDNKVCRDSD